VIIWKAVAGSSVGSLKGGAVATPVMSAHKVCRSAMGSPLKLMMVVLPVGEELPAVLAGPLEADVLLLAAGMLHGDAGQSANALMGLFTLLSIWVPVGPALTMLIVKTPAGSPLHGVHARKVSACEGLASSSASTAYGTDLSARTNYFCTGCPCRTPTAVHS